MIQLTGVASRRVGHWVGGLLSLLGLFEVPEMYTMSPQGRYWYRHGVNRNAVIARVLAVASAMLPALCGRANFSWFVGMFCGAFFYSLLARRYPSA